MSFFDISPEDDYAAMYENDCHVLSSDIWSRLPIELLREVILHLALTDPRMARSLRLVSRHANVWVLPLLFRTLTFTTPEHIIRFASTLLPKRKLHIPALKSILHTFPRPLSSYDIESVALVVKTRLPSVETALASVAPAFTRVKNLVITGQNLSSNAHWLRQHPIHPQHMMILHFGSPHIVNFREPIFQSVTHLYTSVLMGHRETWVVDLPLLTHLAVHTRVNLPAEMVQLVIDQIYKVLQAMPQLEHFVLVLGSKEIYDPKLENWKVLLKRCQADRRFAILPVFRDPRLEWRDMLERRDNIWDRTKAWYSVENEDDFIKIQHRAAIWAALYLDDSSLQRPFDPEWEIDLVQRDNYSPYEGDPTERREATLSMLH